MSNAGNAESHPGRTKTGRKQPEDPSQGGSVIPRRIAFINEKGGSGKTTLVANIAAHLAAKRGYRTLAIDMDPQGQLGKVLGIEVRQPDRTSIELLVNGLLGEDKRRTDTSRPRSELPIRPTRIPNLDIVVSNKALALFPTWTGEPSWTGEPTSTGEPSRVYGTDTTQRLRETLDRSSVLTDYDFVLIDSPPSFGPLTLNILCAVDEVVVPCPLTFLALDGCAELMRTMSMVRQRYHRPELRVSMVIPTFYRRTRLANEILERLKRHFPKEIAHTVVGFHVKIDEAQSHGLSIYEYAPRDRGAATMAALAEELEDRGRPQPTNASGVVGAADSARTPPAQTVPLEKTT